MISLILFVAAIVITLGYAFKNRENYYENVVTAGRGSVRTLNRKLLNKTIAIGVFGITLSLVQPFTLDRVDFGNIGLKVNLTGNARGVSDYQYKNGWVVCNSWAEQLYEFPAWQQHIEYPIEEVIAKGGLPLKIKPTFNYSLKTEKVGDMFVNLRLDMRQLEDGWMKTAILGAMLDVAGKWTSDEIFNHREKFEGEITAECNKRLSKWFTVSQIKTNVRPPDALVQSITDQAKAIKDAQTETQRVVVIRAQAEKKIATARGDSANVVIRAMGNARATIETALGEARAMKEKQKELTPLYVEYTKALGWDGKVSQTVLGNNTGTLVNLK